MANRRADGTNPRSLGTNPRATAAQGEGAASSGHLPDGARQEVSPQINPGTLSLAYENAVTEYKRGGANSAMNFGEWVAEEKKQGRDWLVAEVPTQIPEVATQIKKVPRRAYGMPNGMLAVFDDVGEQVPEWQGPIAEMLPKLRLAHPGCAVPELKFTQIPTDESGLDGKIVGPPMALRETDARMVFPQPPPEKKRDLETTLQDGVREAVVAATDAELEQRDAEARFMAQVESATRLNVHDDDCPERKGKECGCRENLVRLDKEQLPWLEEIEQAWDITVWGPKDPETKKPTSRVVHERAVLVRVDDGRKRTRKVPDPTSPHSGRFIEYDEFDPPRWICTSCAQSMRSNSAKDISHQCDDARKAKASKPMGLDRSLPPELKFGGAYRLVVWMDRTGSYHLGEELVVGNVVKEIRPLAGPEPYHVIEGAILDAAVTRLAP